MERYINVKVPRCLSGYFVYQHILNNNFRLVLYNTEYNIRELDKYLQVNKETLSPKVKRIIIKTKNKYKYLISQYKYRHTHNKFIYKINNKIASLDNYYKDLMSSLINDKDVDLNGF